MDAIFTSFQVDTDALPFSMISPAPDAMSGIPDGLDGERGDAGRSRRKRAGMSPAPTRGECPVFPKTFGPPPRYANEVLRVLWEGDRPMSSAEVLKATGKDGVAGKSLVAVTLRRLVDCGYASVQGRKPHGLRYSIAPRESWGVRSKPATSKRSTKTAKAASKEEVVALLHEFSALRAKIQSLVEAMGASS